MDQPVAVAIKNSILLQFNLILCGDKMPKCEFEPITFVQRLFADFFRKRKIKVNLFLHFASRIGNSQ